MGVGVEFTDNSEAVKEALERARIAYLYEAAGELTSQTKRNSRVDTGQLKGSWDYVVDESSGYARVGSPLENAIWEEFGTGEYAANRDGRKGGWVYTDAKGVNHFTFGKRPNHTLMNAYLSIKNSLIKRANQIFKDGVGK